jgi:ABC-type enterochelin transport system permease subunit
LFSANLGFTRGLQFQILAAGNFLDHSDVAFDIALLAPGLDFRLLQCIQCRALIMIPLAGLVCSPSGWKLG